MSTRREGGSAALEMTILAPVLIMFLLLVVGLGRMALASQDVTAAAHDAARAASLERVVGASAGEGRAAAERALGDRGMACASLSVTVDVSGYQPGGQVTADVACTAELGDLALSGLPGTKTYRASATVPIEQYRADR
jgi:Flp pilus assembly protein TadG